MDLVRSDARVEELLRLGREFLDKRKFAEAEWQFTQARERAPDSAEVYYCIGLFFTDIGRHADAMAAFDRAIAIDDSHSRAHNNRGSALQQQGRLPEAEASYRRAVELSPRESVPYVNLANVVDQQFRTAEALAIYDLALERGVEPELITHYRSALIGQASKRTPVEWIRGTFDNFAPYFDEQMAVTQYGVPWAIAQVLQDRTQPGNRLLDLGCGTGLVAAALADRKLSLTGVDVSSRMLMRAREKGAYQHLHLQEVHDFLDEAASGYFDVVCAADVLNYIGDLSELFEQIYRALKPSGLLAFSIEESIASDYALNNKGRHAHSRGYLRTLAGLRFRTLEDTPGPLRYEAGVPVPGRVYLMERL